MASSGKYEHPSYLKFKDFVERSGLKAGTIEGLITKGKLPAYSEGGVRYIAASELERLGEILGRVQPHIRNKELANGDC